MIKAERSFGYAADHPSGRPDDQPSWNSSSGQPHAPCLSQRPGFWSSCRWRKPKARCRSPRWLRFR